MPIVLGLLDSVLAAVIDSIVDLIDLPDCAIIAGKRGVQLVDLTLSAQFVIEK